MQLNCDCSARWLKIPHNWRRGNYDSVAMAKHGSVCEYDHSTEDWDSYTERLEQYFMANDVEDASKKRAVLLSACGATTYGLIRSLVAPKKVTEFSYSAIVEKVKVHHSPRPSAIVQRFKFNMRQRQKGESVSDYVAALRKLTEFCEFGETLEDMLRDRLVCRINDSRIQHRLLAESKLTFKKALEIAQAMELADRDAKDLQASSSASHEQVHKVLHRTHQDSKSPRNANGKDSRSNCYRCGGKHSATVCKFKAEKCHACGKLGHIAKLCRARMSSSKPHSSKRQDMPRREQTLNVQEYTLCQASDQNTAPIRTAIKINHRDVQMEVDTGASVSVMSETTWKKLQGVCWRSSLSQTSERLRTYTGEDIPVLGQALVAVQSGNQTAQLPILVVAGNGPSLLGRNWLTQLRSDWKEIHHTSAKMTLQDVLAKHAVVFSYQLGKIVGVKAKLYVKKDV